MNLRLEPAMEHGSPVAVRRAVIVGDRDPIAVSGFPVRSHRGDYVEPADTGLGYEARNAMSTSSTYQRFARQRSADGRRDSAPDLGIGADDGDIFHSSF